MREYSIIRKLFGMDATRPLRTGNEPISYRVLREKEDEMQRLLEEAYLDNCVDFDIASRDAGCLRESDGGRVDYD